MNCLTNYFHYLFHHLNFVLTLFIANELDKELVACKTLPVSANVIVGPIIAEY